MRPFRRRRARRARPLDVALAATLHDPRGALADEIRRALPALASVYRGIAVATSPPTAARVVAGLKAAGVHAGPVPTNLRGPLYRLSLRAALLTGAARVHYLDFDRALHWARRAPHELRAVVRLALRHPVLVVGRTAKAHRSHHVPLWSTEVLANRLIADRLGLARPLDVLVPSFVVERTAAARLLAQSRARDNALYGEWAARVLALADEVAYVECRGLDWETPDRYRRAVRRVGLAAWRRRQETAAEWDLRIGIAAEIVRGFSAARRSSTSGPLVRRLPPRAG
jgi:hypothetical protein